MPIQNAPMKIALSILLVTSFACSKTSPEEKAKKLIKDHLYVTLHDFKSYEPVKFDKLDSNYTSYLTDPQYKRWKKKYDEFIDESRRAHEMAGIYAGSYYLASYYKKYMKQASTAMDSASILLDKITDLAKNFKHEFIGWRMSHSYRSKNLQGNLGIHHYEYYFDKELTKVVDHEDIGVPDKHDEL